MQSTVENLVSGIFILTNKKIRLGEFVQFMGSLKIMGTIEEINIRYTVIRTFDKRRTIIPNSIVAKTPIRTLKSEPLLRGEIIFIVPRHTPVEQFKATFIQTINGHKNILYPEYTSIMINNFTDSGIELK
jgi:small-conductance mechanosensitive channel